MSTPDKNTIPPSESAAKSTTSKAGEKTENTEANNSPGAATSLAPEDGPMETAVAPGSSTPGNDIAPPPDVERSDFERLDGLVRSGVAAACAIGGPLTEIYERGLWKAGGYRTWEGYCREVLGMSKSQAHRLMEHSKLVLELSETSPIGDVSIDIAEMPESALRPLKKIKDADARRHALMKAVKDANGRPTAKTVAKWAAKYLTESDESSAAAGPEMESQDATGKDQDDAIEVEVVEVAEGVEGVEVAEAGEAVEDTDSPLQEADTNDEEASTPQADMLLKNVPPTDAVIKSLTALIGSVEKLLDDGGDPAEGDVEQIRQLTEKLGPSLCKLLPAIAPMVVPSVPSDPEIEVEAEVIDDDASDASSELPNKWICKKWLMTLSQIRSEAHGENRKEVIIKFANEVETGIRSLKKEQPAATNA